MCTFVHGYTYGFRGNTNNVDVLVVVVVVVEVVTVVSFAKNLLAMVVVFVSTEVKVRKF